VAARTRDLHVAIPRTVDSADLNHQFHFERKRQRIAVAIGRGASERQIRLRLAEIREQTDCCTKTMPCSAYKISRRLSVARCCMATAVWAHRVQFAIDEIFGPA